MPGSRLEFIPSSKWSWHLEGEAVLEAMTEFFTSILPSQVADRSFQENAHDGLSLLATLDAVPTISVDGPCGEPCKPCQACRACPVQ